MTEEWRAIAGHEGAYEVSNLGRVRSLERLSRGGRRIGGRDLKLVRGSGGYLQVNLYGASGPRAMLVHRLVLAAFGGAPGEGMQARHLDGDQSNNRADNLAWGTSSENIRDQLRHGTQANARKTHCPQGHPYAGGNLYVQPNGDRKCRACRARNLAAWQESNPDRFREIRNRANDKWRSKRREGRAA